VGARPIRIVRGAGVGQPGGEQVVRTLDELLDLLQ
jgi:hypothetical protein